MPQNGIRNNLASSIIEEEIENYENEAAQIIESHADQMNQLIKAQDLSKAAKYFDIIRES